MGSTLPISSPTKAEHRGSADPSSGEGLHFDDDDYDSDFPDSKPAPRIAAAETYTLSDVLALVQEGLSQNAHDHAQLLHRLNTLESNLGKRIIGKEQAKSPTDSAPPSPPTPSPKELFAENSEIIAQPKEEAANAKPINSDVAFVESLRSQLRDATAAFEMDVTALITEFKSPARISSPLISPSQRAELVKPTIKASTVSCAPDSVVLVPSPETIGSSPRSPSHSASGSIEDEDDVYFPCVTDHHLKPVEASSNNRGSDEEDIYADMPPLMDLDPLDKNRLAGISPVTWFTTTTPIKPNAADSVVPIASSTLGAPPSSTSTPPPLVTPLSEPTATFLPSSRSLSADIEGQRKAIHRLSFDAIRRFAIPPRTSPITAEAHPSASPSNAIEQPHDHVPATLDLASFIKQSMVDKATKKDSFSLLSSPSQGEAQETYLTAAKAEVRLQEQARQLGLTERVLARREKALAREQARIDAERVELEVKKAELEQRGKEWKIKQHAELVSMREQMARLREQVHEQEEHKKATDIPPSPDTTEDDYFKLLKSIESDKAWKDCERLTLMRDEALKNSKEAIAEQEYVSEMERVE